MHWRAWSATDAAIRGEFGYAVAHDRASAEALRPLVPPANRIRDLAGVLRGKPVAILGCGPTLTDATARDLDGLVPVAADGACSWLREAGVPPAVVVTDLDGSPDDLAWAGGGAAMVVHAHGDNRPAIQELTPMLGHRIYGTYQGPPSPGLSPLENIGGFTDGDRALLLCEHLGARTAHLFGFDFDGPPGRHSHRWDPMTKPRKLAWAKRITEGVRARGRLRLVDGASPHADG